MKVTESVNAQLPLGVAIHTTHATAVQQGGRERMCVCVCVAIATTPMLVKVCTTNRLVPRDRGAQIATLGSQRWTSIPRQPSGANGLSLGFAEVR